MTYVCMLPREIAADKSIHGQWLAWNSAIKWQAKRLAELFPKVSKDLDDVVNPITKHTGIQSLAIENHHRNVVDFPINSMVDLSSSLCERLPEGMFHDLFDSNDTIKPSRKQLLDH